MDRQTELELIDELLGLSDAGSAYLDEAVTTSPTADYCDPARFAREMAGLFRRAPLIACHSSELPDPGAFLRRELAGQPALITRDRDGRAHAFLNVCRHRGARLVDEPQGCKFAFSCPYHAWTWSNAGELRGIPQQQQGFPDIDKSQYGLTRLPCVEQGGWVWAVPDPAAQTDIAAHLAPLMADLAWLDTEDLQIIAQDHITCAANWKLLIEGGIEAYHFRVAHADTIGPYFPDNLSSYRMLGAHMRSVLPRLTFPDLAQVDRPDRHLRDHANLVYTVFPTTQFLVQQDHLVWVQLDPVAADSTRLTLSTMAPVAEAHRDAHWQKNHAITLTTLREDFDIGEAIQSGLRSGANRALTFGRYEGALHRFAQTVQAALAQ